MVPPIRPPANVPAPGSIAVPILAPNAAPAKPPPAVPTPPIGSPLSPCKIPCAKGNLLPPIAATLVAAFGSTVFLAVAERPAIYFFAASLVISLPKAVRGKVLAK